MTKHMQRQLQRTLPFAQFGNKFRHWSVTETIAYIMGSERNLVV